MLMRQLGRNGPMVSAIGLGCMGMSPGIYDGADEAEGIATVQAALDAGITLLDTGDFYGMGDNEMLLRRALAGGRRDKAFIQVKFGALRTPAGAWAGYDLRPAAIRNFLAYSLKRLGTDHIDLYLPARLDPAVPIEETVGAITDLVSAGYVRHIGLSEVGAATLRRAAAVHPIAALQIEYSLMSRGIEAEILPTCRALGIAVNAYSVLSRGLLAGRAAAERASSGSRRRFPRFQASNLGRNLELVAALEAIARERNTTPAALAIAWVLSRGEDIVPVVGARHRDQLSAMTNAAAIALDAADLARIEAAVPAAAVAGTRYDPHNMALLDSENLA